MAENKKVKHFGRIEMHEVDENDPAATEKFGGIAPEEFTEATIMNVRVAFAKKEDGVFVMAINGADFEKFSDGAAQKEQLNQGIVYYMDIKTTERGFGRSGNYAEPTAMSHKGRDIDKLISDVVTLTTEKVLNKLGSKKDAPYMVKKAPAKDM